MRFASGLKRGSKASVETYGTPSSLGYILGFGPLVNSLAADPCFFDFHFPQIL